MLEISVSFVVYWFPTTFIKNNKTRKPTLKGRNAAMNVLSSKRRFTTRKKMLLRLTLSGAKYFCGYNVEIIK